MEKKPIRIGLVQLGDFINGMEEVDKVVKFMNRDQNIFAFNKIPSLSFEEIGTPELGDIYYSDQQLYSLIEAKIKNIQNINEEIIIAITNVRICKKEVFQKYEGENDLDFFSVSDIPNKIGIVSIVPWLYYFEDKTYRSTEQYISFNIIPIICEILLGEPLFHFDFHQCIFDECWDLNQIIGGMKKARICPRCKQRLESKSFSQEIECLDKILMKVRRPPYSEILRYFQENSTTNLFVLGIILSTVIGFFSNISYLAIVFFVIFIAMIIRQHYSPSGRLG